ncbi:hypothetical protein JIG36_37375 [Actinoplanes sp. LDG1-06]|uniref:Uncharacterized protein n=1 Tax=Paractinoplanes ovalisporus TaxID=2810368 RepID=A0ABS2AMZ2_9ACTN|nr:hypothetical protein [Actinoplanes ovalisporus]MBM2621189.1 hypothetical protein [Actinoplanes ovalisporus]
MDISTWGGSEWQAVAAFVAVFVGGPIALMQANEARRLRLEQARPYVIVDFEFRSVVVYLKIHNIGKTMARDVRIKFDHPLTSTLSSVEALESRLLSEPIPMLAPGRSISLVFDSFPARYSRRDEFPMDYAVTVEYDDDLGKPYSDPPYPLDLRTYVGSAVDPKGLPELVDEVGKVRRELHKWTDGSRGLLVNAVDRDAKQKREIRPYRLQEYVTVFKEQGVRAVARHGANRTMKRLGWRS